MFDGKISEKMPARKAVRTSPSLNFEGFLDWTLSFAGILSVQLNKVNVLVLIV